MGVIQNTAVKISWIEKLIRVIVLIYSLEKIDVL